MKVSVLQENLSQALSLASRFVNQRAQLPVLGNIMLTAQRAHLLVSATNLETSVVTKIGAKVEAPGEITVPATTITSIIGNLNQGSIDLTLEKEKLKIKAPSFNGAISGINSSDFPAIPQSLGKEAITLEAKTFSRSLSQVLFASSIDEARPILTGALMLFKGSTLVMVSTDGFRLSQKKLSLKSKVGETSVIVPRNILSEILKATAKQSQLSFQINKKDNQVIFGVGESVFSSRVIQGEFPAFEKIIPKTTKTKINLSKEDLIRAIKLSSVFAKDSANSVDLMIEKGSVTISAKSTTTGTQKTKIDAKVEGPELNISYNYRFIEEFLGNVVGESIEISFNDQSSPGIFLDPTDPDYLHLIMPIKTQS